jgi:hypothetical protein
MMGQPMQGYPQQQYWGVRWANTRLSQCEKIR